MVKYRKISLGNYVLAAIVTLLVFSLGVVIGIVVDNARLNTVEASSRQARADYTSLQFQYLFLTDLIAEEDLPQRCSFIEASLERTVTDLSEAAEKLEVYSQSSWINQDEYDFWRRTYFVQNLQYWLLSRKAVELCGLDVVSVLYFYSTEKCPNCGDQGVILSYYKKILGERLLVFPLDVDIGEQEEVVGLIQRTYGVTAYPTIVVEGEKYEGVVGKDELQGIMCAHYLTPNEVCTALNAEILNASITPDEELPDVVVGGTPSR